MKQREPSLKWPLIIQPLILQLIVLLVSFFVIIALGLRFDSGGYYTEQTLTRVAADAVYRKPDGTLGIGLTPELAALGRENPGLWFVASDDQGLVATYGDVPQQYREIATVLTQLSWADLRDRQPPFRLTAVIRQESGAAGSLTIMGHGRLISVSLVGLMALNLAVVPIFLLLCGVSLIVTPWIVRRSLAGVERIAAEANLIDTERRGVRLTETAVPREIAPLVRAVNQALSRLDDGYERQRRFIASAAHELRTPIAILRIKTETAGESAVRRLGGEIDRLANLAEQLLDLQRLDGALSTKQIDLALLVRQVAADLAPLLIAADRDVEVIVEDAKSICGDAGAIERAITNLVQNAIQHGGRQLILRVLHATIEVEDDGPGIPPDERERVFEPFHRVRPHPSGSGLGLNLVQQVVDRHGGGVSIVEASGGGTIVRMVFRPAEA